MEKIDATKLLIRPARLADCEAVMTIEVPQLYCGFDYLKAKYQKFLDSPVVYPFVAEYNGEMVGYVCQELLDDGKLFKFGWRIKPEYQGKGIGSRLSAESLVSAEQQMGTPPTGDCYVTILTAQTEAKAAAGRYSQTYWWHDLRVECNISSLNQHCSNSSGVQQLSETEAMTILADESNRDRLFGEGKAVVLDVYMKAVRLSIKNLQETVSLSHTLCSYASSSSEIEGMCFYTLNAIKHGYRLDAYFYGTSEEACVKQIQFACMKATEGLQPNDNLYIAMHIQRHFDWQRVQDGLRSMLKSDVEFDHRRFGLYSRTADTVP